MTDSFDQLRRFATVLGWGALLVILFATLSPLDLRPHIPELGADIERFLAYLAAGGLLAFAYPRQRWFVLGGMVVFALGLEWAQTWEATRHGRPHDVVVKVLGTLSGGGLAVSLDYLGRRLRRLA